MKHPHAFLDVTEPGNDPQSGTVLILPGKSPKAQPEALQSHRGRVAHNSRSFSGEFSLPLTNN